MLTPDFSGSERNEESGPGPGFAKKNLRALADGNPPNANFRHISIVPQLEIVPTSSSCGNFKIVGLNIYTYIYIYIHIYIYIISIYIYIIIHWPGLLGRLRLEIGLLPELLRQWRLSDAKSPVACDSAMLSRSCGKPNSKHYIT